MVEQKWTATLNKVTIPLPPKKEVGLKKEEEQEGKRKVNGYGAEEEERK